MRWSVRGPPARALWDSVAGSAWRGGVSSVRLCAAQVWGTSSQHYPQRCGLKHVLEDQDVVQVRPCAVRRRLCFLAGSPAHAAAAGRMSAVPQTRRRL